MSTAVPPLAAGAQRRAAIVALVAVQLSFGLFPIAAKWAFVPGGFAPAAVAVWRIAFGAAVLVALAFLAVGRAAWPRRADWPRLVACGVLGVAANMTIYLEGLRRSTAVDAGLVMCLIPVFTYAIAAALRHESFSGRRLAGIALALVGASLLFWAERPGLSREHLVGNALMALNALSYATYLVIARPLFTRYPPIVVIAWVFATSVPWIPAAIVAHGWQAGAAADVGALLLPPDAPGRAVGALVFVLLFPTALAYFLNAFALARVRASTTAVFIYLQPIVTTSAGALVLGEELSRVALLSGLLVFAGIALVVVRGAASPVARAPART